MYTGFLTTYNSFTSPNYKKGLIKTLTERTFRVSSTWSGFNYDILNLEPVLQKNEFPLNVIDKIINKYLSNNVFKQKENEQMTLLESSKKCTKIVNLIRTKNLFFHHLKSLYCFH